MNTPEKFNRAQTLERIKKGPLAIMALRRNIIEGTMPPTISSATQVLDSLGYPPSNGQLDILRRSLPTLMEHRSGIDEFNESYDADPALATLELSKQIGCSLGDIEDLTIHSSSLTVALKSPAFRSAWVNGDESDKELRQRDLPRGFTSSVLSFKAGLFQVPYSLRGPFSTEKTAKHEDRHVQYRYLHPEFASEEKTDSQYREKLAKQTKELVADNDKAGLKKLLGKVVHDTVWTYLTELAADVSRIGGVGHYFTEGNSYYGGNIDKTFEAIKSSFPENLADRVKYEYLIFEAKTILNHRIQFLDINFANLHLISKYSGTEQLQFIQAVVEFLTPDRGYLIKAFAENDFLKINPSLEMLRKWKQEYDRPKVSEQELKESFWTDFIIACAGISEDDYLALYTTSNAFFANHTQTSLRENDISKDISDIKSIIVSITKTRVAKLSGVLDTGILDLANLDPQSKKRIFTKVLTTICNFGDLMTNLAYLVDRIKGLSSTDRRKILNQQMDLLTKDAVMADEVSEELTENLAQGIATHWEELTKPRFIRADDKKELALQRIESNTYSEAKLDSPYEEETFQLLQAFFRENGSDIDKKKFSFSDMRRISSMLIRLVMWAKEKGYGPEQLKNTCRFLEDLNANSDLPFEYETIAKEALADLVLAW